MTITTEDGGRQNMFAKEPKMYITEEDKMSYENETHNERAEILNGSVPIFVILYCRTTRNTDKEIKPVV